MINDQLLQRAINLVERDPSLYGWKKGDNEELNALGEAILEKSACRGCPGAKAELFNELRTFVQNLMLNSNTNQMEKSNFTLPEGSVLHDMAKGKVFPNDNLTDVEVLDLLSRNPRSIKQFKNAPKDWEKQVKDYVASKEASKKPAVKAKEETVKTPPAKPEKTAKPEGDKPKGPAKPAKATPPAKPEKPVIVAPDVKDQDDDDDDDSQE
mgnify:CR=1 FL=1